MIYTHDIKELALEYYLVHHVKLTPEEVVILTLPMKRKIVGHIMNAIHLARSQGGPPLIDKQEVSDD